MISLCLSRGKGLRLPRGPSWGWREARTSQRCFWPSGLRALPSYRPYVAPAVRTASETGGEQLGSLSKEEEEYEKECLKITLRHRIELAMYRANTPTREQYEAVTSRIDALLPPLKKKLHFKINDTKKKIYNDPKNRKVYLDKLLRSMERIIKEDQQGDILPSALVKTIYYIDNKLYELTGLRKYLADPELVGFYVGKEYTGEEQQIYEQFRQKTLESFKKIKPIPVTHILERIKKDRLEKKHAMEIKALEDSKEEREDAGEEDYEYAYGGNEASDIRLSPIMASIEAELKNPAERDVKKSIRQFREAKMQDKKLAEQEAEKEEQEEQEEQEIPLTMKEQGEQEVPPILKVIKQETKKEQSPLEVLHSFLEVHNLPRREDMRFLYPPRYLSLEPQDLGLEVIQSKFHREDAIRLLGGKDSMFPPEDTVDAFHRFTDLEIGDHTSDEVKEFMFKTTMEEFEKAMEVFCAIPRYPNTDYLSFDEKTTPDIVYDIEGKRPEMIDGDFDIGPYAFVKEVHRMTEKAVKECLKTRGSFATSPAYQALPEKIPLLLKDPDIISNLTAEFIRDPENLLSTPGPFNKTLRYHPVDNVYEVVRDDRILIPNVPTLDKELIRKDFVARFEEKNIDTLDISHIEFYFDKVSIQRQHAVITFCLKEHAPEKLDNLVYRSNNPPATDENGKPRKTVYSKLPREYTKEKSYVPPDGPKPEDTVHFKRGQVPTIEEVLGLFFLFGIRIADTRCCLSHPDDMNVLKLVCRKKFFEKFERNENFSVIYKFFDSIGVLGIEQVILYRSSTGRLKSPLYLEFTTHDEAVAALKLLTKFIYELQDVHTRDLFSFVGFGEVRGPFSRNEPADPQPKKIKTLKELRYGEEELGYMEGEYFIPDAGDKNYRITQETFKETLDTEVTDLYKKQYVDIKAALVASNYDIKQTAAQLHLKPNQLTFFVRELMRQNFKFDFPKEVEGRFVQEVLIGSKEELEEDMRTYAEEKADFLEREEELEMELQKRETERDKEWESQEYGVQRKREGPNEADLEREMKRRISRERFVKFDRDALLEQPKINIVRLRRGFKQKSRRRGMKKKSKEDGTQSGLTPAPNPVDDFPDY